MFNESLNKILRRNFGKENSVKKCLRQSLILFTVSTFWTGSEVENEVLREKEERL